MSDRIQTDREIPREQASGGDVASQRLLADSSTLGHTKAIDNRADSGLDKETNFVAAVISQNGNFGGPKSRELIGTAFQSANQSGQMQELAGNINQVLTQRNLEADYRVVAYTGSGKDGTRLIGVDLHKDSITDGMSLSNQSGSKLAPLQESALPALAEQISTIIGSQEGLGDKNQRHEIQTDFQRAVQAGLAEKLATQVDQDLAKSGHQEFYVAERSQFKDSSGNPIPELVLHLQETSDSITAPEKK